MMDEKSHTQRVSLLWHETTVQTQAQQRTSAGTIDLELNDIAEALSIDQRHIKPILNILQALNTDIDVICYRQNVLEDLMRNPELIPKFEALLKKIDSFDRYADRGQWYDSQLHQVSYRLGELSNFVDVVIFLRDMLDEIQDKLQSTAFKRLREAVQDIAGEETFNILKQELPDLLKKLENIHSLTIGVNLTHDLIPEGATILAVNDFKFKGESSFISRLFRAQGNKPDNEGISQLHTANGNGMNPYGMGGIPLEMSSKRAQALLEPLMKDLSGIMDKIAHQIAQSLRKYMQVDVGFLVALGDEIAFYLGAVRLIEQMRTCGLTMCKPDIAPIDERVCQMTDVFNLNLALHLSKGKRTDLTGKVVSNDVDFGENGRIFILTGPNRGGKTVFTTSIGLAQVMAQAGLYVPAKLARISPVDNIFTHFARVEQIKQQTGRLGEEAKRLNEIFSKATAHSLLLLNESFSSTSSGESYFLARDIVRVMRMMGTRAIFATHLHELAMDVDNINADTEGDSKIISVIATVITEETNADGEVARRTYKIIPAPPMGKSYAQQIARQYGISYDQLVDNLRRRNILPDE